MGIFGGSTLARPTMIATTTSTLLDVDPPQNLTSGFLSPDGTLNLPNQIFILLLVFSIPFTYLWASAQNDRLEQKATDAYLHDRLWRQVWQTNDWQTLFGLIGLANDNRWTDINPFWGYPSIYKAWHAHNRPWCKRLLALGIVPLFVQDGGMTTYCVPFKKWGLGKRFPYVRTPVYQQGKKRAYMEFLVPFPHEEPAREEFLTMVMANRRIEDIHDFAMHDAEDFAYGVVTRRENGRVRMSKANPPEDERKPLEVGARSWLEPLLPFKKDVVLKRGFGEKISMLADYIRNFDEERVPLLAHAPWVLVRIEAKYFGQVQLDRFVFHLAQEAKLSVWWPENACRDAALAEIERLGLSTAGLRPYDTSVPNRYH